MNITLFSMIYSIASTVIIGLLIIAALVIGYDEIRHIIALVVAGLVISVPVGLFFTKQISKIGTQKET